MVSSLDDAMKRLESALGLLEASVARRLELEKRRGDLETELQIMQDDRARLALELDGALARLQRAEAAADHAGARVRHAIEVIEDMLTASDEAETD
jgi:exonuclease VII small subunit